jgi:hypothetical protein
MTMLRQKVDHELDALDNRSMAAVYEQLRLLNSMRRAPVKRRVVMQNIENVLRLTSSSKGCWSEAVLASREERL